MSGGGDQRQGGGSSRGLLTFAATLVGAAAGAGLAFFFANKEKESLEQQLADSERRKDNFREMMNRDNLPGSCKICMDNPLEVALEPCGHTVCQKCAQLVNSCPYCMQKIRGRKRIYLN